MMVEIRVAWNVIGRRNIVNEGINGGTWCLDCPENREDLEIIVECGNEAYGPGSHWLEAREA